MVAMEEGLAVVGSESGHFSTLQGDSSTETSGGDRHGSGFFKLQRSGHGEDDWRSTKIAKANDFYVPRTLPLHRETSLLRSNKPLVSATGGPLMLSFSSAKAETPLFSGSSGEKTYQNPPFSVYQKPSKGNGCGGPFTVSQMMELEHQVLTYKYIVANMPIPSNLLFPLHKYIFSGSYAHNSLGWGPFRRGFSGNIDNEPWRCRRTDGKKWRCSNDAFADKRYCEKHIKRNRHRSRKPVEGQNGHVASSTNALVNRMKVEDEGGPSTTSSTTNINLKQQQQQQPPFQQSEHGFISSNSRNTNSFLNFNTNWLKNESVLDRTQLSISIPTSSNNYGVRDGLELSPLSLSRESDQNQKEANWGPISWGNSMGGPLGEVFDGTSYSNNINPNLLVADDVLRVRR